ncbi:unnamed protein product, partial [Gulo gulo]
AGPRGPQLSSVSSHAHVQSQTNAKAGLPSSRHTPNTAVLPGRALLTASSWSALAPPPPRDHSPPPSLSPAPAGHPLLPPRPPPNASSNTPGPPDGRSGRWSAPRGGLALAARLQSVSPSSGVPVPPAPLLLPRAPDPPPRLEPPSCLIGVCGAENVAGHLGLGVVGLRLDQVGKVGEIVAVVNEARDVLCLVLEDEHRRVGLRRRGADAPRGPDTGCGDTAQEGRAEHQEHLAGGRRPAAARLRLLAAPADLSHEPGQHWQRGPAVQARPPHVPQPKPFVAGLPGARLRRGARLGLQRVRERLILNAAGGLHNSRLTKAPRQPG